MLRHAAPCCASGGCERWQCEREPAPIWQHDVSNTRASFCPSCKSAVYHQLIVSFFHMFSICFPIRIISYPFFPIRIIIFYPCLIHVCHLSHCFISFHLFSGNFWCLVQDRGSLCLSDVGDRWRASAANSKQMIPGEQKSSDWWIQYKIG